MMSNDLLPLAAPVIAQAVSYALQFAGESMRKGLQGDLYVKLRDAVWNLILSKNRPRRRSRCSPNCPPIPRRPISGCRT